MNFLNKPASHLAIDIGSSRTRIIRDGTIVIDKATEILATISDVVQIENGDIKIGAIEEIIKPVNFEIQDFERFQLLFKDLIKSIEPKSIFRKKYSIFFSIPADIGDVGKRALRDVAELSGANQIYMMHSPICSAINLGLSDNVPFTIVDFGFSKFEISIIYKRAIVSDNSIRLGTNRLELLIFNYVNRNFQISLTGEQIRSLILNNRFKNEYHIVDQTQIPTKDIQRIIDNYEQWIIDICHSTIEKVRSKISIGNDLHFTGGGSLYTELCSDIALQLGKTARFSQNPFIDNVKGLWKASLNL